MSGKGSNERYGPFRQEYQKNKKKILMSQSTCALCGQPVDKHLKYPDPMCATIDHIIPLDRGGHPSDLDNLQLAHLRCNRDKSNKLEAKRQTQGAQAESDGNRNLKWSLNWREYRSK